MDEIIKIWNSLDNINIKFNDYSHLHYKSSFFIRNFHKLDYKTYLKNIKDIKNPKFILYLIKSILDKNSLENILEHRNYIIKNVFYDRKDLNNSEKKRVYLGIIWFILGLIISLVIKYNFNEDISLINLNKISKNNYIIFLTCCYIYYDHIFDSPNINKDDKKTCILYTKYFFEYILGNNNLNIESYELLNLYLINEIKNSLGNNLEKIIEKKKILIRTNRILEILLKEFKKNTNYLIVKAIFELFLTEVSITKNKNEKITEEKILKNTILKSQKSIYAIIQIILGKELNDNKIILNNTYFYGFLTQIIDDLNDIEIDLIENNLTLFTINKNIKIIEKYCIRILKYIYFLFYNEIGKINKDINNKNINNKNINNKNIKNKNIKNKNIKNKNINKNLYTVNYSNYIFNLGIFSYVIGKHKKYFTENFINEIQKFLLFDLNEVKFFRKIKKKLLISDKRLLDKYFNKYNKIYKEFFDKKYLDYYNVKFDYLPNKLFKNKNLNYKNYNLQIVKYVDNKIYIFKNNKKIKVYFYRKNNLLII
jgi:hypothetical protein